MTTASLVAFGLVFFTSSLVLSLLATTSLLLWSQRLRRLGPWVERRAAAAAIVLPPLVAVVLTTVLAGDSALALAGGTDHCVDHDHHRHLCLKHDGQWASHAWGLALVVAAAAFVVARFVLSAWAHVMAQRAADRLRLLGTPLREPACTVVPAIERFAFTAGLLSPTVVLSSGAWDALDPQQRNAILAHELAHVSHGDLWHRAALGLAASMGAPVLVAHVLRRWDLAAERICDRQAALVVGRPSTVASAMLALVRTTPPRMAPPGAVFATASHVAERIESVLREEPSGLRSSQWLLLALTGAALSVAVGSAVFAESLHHVFETILG